MYDKLIKTAICFSCGIYVYYCYKGMVSSSNINHLKKNNNDNTNWKEELRMMKKRHHY